MENLVSLRFPQKLWKIVNESETDAIQWNSIGTSIILNYKKFQKEYLDGMSSSNLFKTTNLTSFIRQLNLYGFRKVSAYCRESYTSKGNDPNTHEFYNIYFVRGRFDLLSQISRKATGNGTKFRKTCMVKRIPHVANSKKCENQITICKKALTKALVNAVNQHDLKENKTYMEQDICINGAIEAQPIIKQKSCTELSNNDLLGTWDYTSLFEDASINNLITSTPIGSPSPVTNAVQDAPDDYSLKKESATFLQSIYKNQSEKATSSSKTVHGQVSWNDIMQQVDNTFSEKICTVLLTNENDENAPPRVIAEPIETPNSLSQSQLYYGCQYSIPITGTLYELNWN